MHALLIPRLELSPTKGFTLIEILLSLAITAVITSLLYGTFRTTINTSATLEQQADVYRRARVLFHQLNKDISMIYHKTLPPGESTLQTSTEGVFETIPFQAKNDIRFSEGGVYPSDTIQFASLSYQPVRKGVPLSGQANISYLLIEDKLVRRAAFREKNIEHEIGESVLGLNFRYFDEKKKDWFEEWEPTTGTFPKAIEIELILKAVSSPSSAPNPSETSVRAYSFKTTFALETLIL